MKWLVVSLLLMVVVLLVLEVVVLAVMAVMVVVPAYNPTSRIIPKNTYYSKTVTCTHRPLCPTVPPTIHPTQQYPFRHGQALDVDTHFLPVTQSNESTLLWYGVTVILALIPTLVLQV